MLPPDLVFSTANTVALPCWLALLLTLFVPTLRRWIWPITGLVVPALLGSAYILLIWQGFAESSGGGFGSIGEVRTLFASDAALVAGWLHYLAFDLFIGTWIARTGLHERIHPLLLLLPCLPLAFLFGPAGLLLFLGMRLVALGKSEREARAS